MRQRRETHAGADRAEHRCKASAHHVLLIGTAARFGLFGDETGSPLIELRVILVLQNILLAQRAAAVRQKFRLRAGHQAFPGGI